MASARFAWGIDIGNRALKAVKLVREGDQLRVDDFELIEHEHVLSNAGDNRDSLIQTALANFVQRHPMKGGIVSVGVSGQSSFARFIKLPPVEERKIPEIVRFEAIQQIPFPLDEVEWSYQLFRNPESPDVEVGIFAMRKELIGKHIQFFTDFDMNVQVVQMNPLAVYNAIYYDQRLKGTTMIVDLGAENTDLIIADNDTIWMRSIPIGGNNFTETLVKAFKLPFAKAEDLKRNAATSKYARQIFQAMRPVFADLVAEIQRSVGFYASVHRDSRIKKIIALGGTFRLPGLQKYLQQNLSLDVERLDNLSAGAPSDPKQAATFNENLLSVVGAYGLAVQAMGEGKVTSSLLPAHIRREKLWKEKTPIFAAAAACFVVGTGVALGGYFMQNLSYENAEGRRSEIAAIESKAKDYDTKWSTIETSGEPDRKLMVNVLGLLQYRDLWRNLLNDMAASIPQPQPQVVEGIRKNDPALVKQVPRNKRDQVIIESMHSRYYPNISTVLTASDSDFRLLVGDGNFQPYQPGMSAQSGGGGPAMPGGFGGGFGGGEFGGMMEAPAPPPPPEGGDPNAQRGFLIIVRGTSPNDQGNALVESKLCAALRTIGPTTRNPKIEYAIKRASMVSFNRIRENPSRLAKLKSDYDQGIAAQQRAAAGSAGSYVGGTPGGGPYGGDLEGGFGGGYPGGGFPGGGFPGQPMPGVGVGPEGVVPEEDISPYKDRLTGEDVRDDWEFTVLVAVVLDPPPPAPPAPPAEPQAAAQ